MRSVSPNRWPLSRISEPCPAATDCFSRNCVPRRRKWRCWCPLRMSPTASRMATAWLMPSRTCSWQRSTRSRSAPRNWMPSRSAATRWWCSRRQSGSGREPSVSSRSTSRGEGRSWRTVSRRRRSRSRVPSSSTSRSGWMGSPTTDSPTGSPKFARQCFGSPSPPWTATIPLSSCAAPACRTEPRASGWSIISARRSMRP